jgi:hypothetical protein
MLPICDNYTTAIPTRCLVGRNARQDCGKACPAYQSDEATDRAQHEIDAWRAWFGFAPEEYNPVGAGSLAQTDP